MHPYDSDSSEDEVDWQDTRDDPYIPGINEFICSGDIERLSFPVNPCILYLSLNRV